MFLQMFFILALRGVYLSETAGLLLAFLVGATLTKWTFHSAFRKNTPQPSSSIPVDENVTPKTSNTIAFRVSHPTLLIVSVIMLGGLFLGGIGAGYGAYLHFHPKNKEKLIERTLNLPHPDNYEYLASAQAIRYMGFWEIVSREAIVAGLAGALIAGLIGLAVMRFGHSPGLGRLRLEKSLLMGLAFFLATALLFGVKSGSGMVYYDGHNQFYWCQQLESKDKAQQRQALQSACALLSGRPFTCRTRMIIALASCGDEGKTAIPVLTELLQDREPIVCAKAAWALTKMGPEGRAAVIPAVPILKKLLGHEYAQVRLTAAEALIKAGPEGEIVAIPALKALLSDENPDVRLNAAKVLGRMGPKATSAVPALKELLHDDNKSISRAVEEALKQIDK